MSKRTTFTNITPLPSTVTRKTAIDFLHNHTAMIDINPLVISRQPISPPPHALPEEHSCNWYSITDKISYLGTDAITGLVKYTCAFHNLPVGLQTHCYAALGLDIRDKWTIGGTEPGEEPERRELGLDIPASGLYLREDVDFKCNILLAHFVKKTLKKSHLSIAERLVAEALRQGGGADGGIVAETPPNASTTTHGTNASANSTSIDNSSSIHGLPHLEISELDGGSIIPGSHEVSGLDVTSSTRKGEAGLSTA